MDTHRPFLNVIQNCIILIFYILCLMRTCASIQTYDKTNCYSQAQLPDSNYFCNSQNTSCNTFIVYRVQTESQTLSSIASIMSADLLELYHLNKLEKSDRLVPGQDIIVPVTCTCQNNHSRVDLVYNYSSLSSSDHYTSLADVACVMFEGLVKAQILINENLEKEEFEFESGDNLSLKVPLKCACSVPFTKLYYVTYPVVMNDSLILIAAKFNVTINDIADANRLKTSSTIYPQTTLIIPVYGRPEVNRTVEDQSLNPTSAFPVDKIGDLEKSDSNRVYSILGCGIVVIIVCLILGFFGFVKIKKRYVTKDVKFERFSDKMANRMSPDFVAVMSELKRSVINFTSEEIRKATNNFDKGNVVGSSVFIGRANNGAKYAIQVAETDESIDRTVNILTRINHINIVKLIGCCYEKNQPYLVFQFAENGSLRDCLSCKKRSKQLTWNTRKQIAFDLASALHYIHYSTTPSYLHCNINSKNVLITSNFRAKITGFGSAKPLINVSDKMQLMKTDVYGFGVVLLELMLGKEVVVDDDVGVCLKDCVSLEKVREFKDVEVEGECGLGSVLCVAMLAKCCVADDPEVRPNMNDVLKTLSTVA